MRWGKTVGLLRPGAVPCRPVSPRLFVSTTGTDSDWDVKLIDVYDPQNKLDEPRTDVGAPEFTMGGYEHLVRGEPFRGKFRHSFESQSLSHRARWRKWILPCRM